MPETMDLRNSLSAASSTTAQASPAGPPASPRRRGRVPAILMAVLLLAGVAAVSWVFHVELARRFAAAKRHQPSPAIVGEYAISPKLTPTTNPSRAAATPEAGLIPMPNPSRITASSVEAHEYPEYGVKAALLVKFAEYYLTWPNSVFLAPDSPLRIGVLGDDRFGGTLDLMCQGVDCGNEKRKIVIVRSHKADELKRCQMVFVSESEKGHVPEVLGALDGASIVTVGETAGFTAQSGMINFYIADGKVRFEINNYAAIRHEITISPDLIAISRPRR